MNKAEFVDYMAKQHNCAKAVAEKAINMFTNSMMDALSSGNEILLIGFGSFRVSKVPARDGRNPQTGAAIKIAAHNQVRFKAGQKLKDACNA